MKKNIRKTGSILVTLAFVTFVAMWLTIIPAGCGGECDGGISARAQIEEGKAWLTRGDGDRARLYFLEALELDPGNPDGLYGMALSDTLHVVDVLSILVDYILSLIESGGPVKDREEPPSWVDDLLETLLNTLLFDRTYELEEYSGKAREIPGITFDAESIPILIAFDPVATLSGEFDETDLLASESLTLLLRGFLLHALVLELDFDLASAWMISEIDFDTLPPEEAAAEVVRLLLAIVADPDYPDFLTMSSEGVDTYREAGMAVGDGFDRFISVFESIRNETDDQDDDIIGYTDLNGNGGFDTGEPFFIPHFGELDEREMAVLDALVETAGDLRDAYWDRTAKDTDPYSPNPFRLSSLNPVLEAYGLPPLFPGWIKVDIGIWYAEPSPRRIRNSLILILYLLSVFL
ncbi:tetratricopeptide repeat protein, partial [Thermodesulfobacteriota bacterium]